MYAVKRLKNETVFDWYRRVYNVAKISMTMERIIDLFISLSYHHCKSLTDLKFMRACLLKHCNKSWLNDYATLINLNFDAWVYYRIQLHVCKKRLWKESQGILPNELRTQIFAYLKDKPAPICVKYQTAPEHITSDLIVADFFDDMHVLMREMRFRRFPEHENYTNHCLVDEYGMPLDNTTQTRRERKEQKRIWRASGPKRR